MVLVEMDKRGSVTLPEAARAALNLGEEARLELEVIDGTIVLRPAAAPNGDEEDDWVYTPEQMERIRRGLADIEAGRMYRLGEEDLLELADRMDVARREGREYRPTEQELRAMEAKHVRTDS